MARLVVGSRSFDMTAWDLSDIAGGTVTSDGAGEVDVTGAGAFFDYKIKGSGFTSFDTNGFPTAGTVTSVAMDVPGKTPLNITGISISAADFMGFVNGNDAAGLEAAIFAGNDSFTGRAGNDVLLGFGGNDTFNLSKGGNDTAQGGDGDDTFNMLGALTAADTIDGGAGSDKVVLHGDYTAGVVFGATTMTNVEDIILVKGHDYKLTLNEATVGAGQTLLINGTGLRSGDVMEIDTSADTDGRVRVYGGGTFSYFTGGAGISEFHGAGANNVFTLDAFNAADKILGVGHNDTLYLNADFSTGLTLTRTEVSDVSRITFLPGHDYDITIGAKFDTLSFVGSLGAGDTLTLDDSAATANVSIQSSAGANTITGGSGNDEIDTTGNGVEIIDGGGGQNQISVGNWNNADHIDCGTGGGSLTISAPSGAIEIAAGTIENVETIVLGGTSLDLTMDDGNLAAGQNLYLYLEETSDISVDASAETAGKYAFEVVDNGANSVRPVATLTGGAGDDVFNFAVSNSTFSVLDRIDGGAGNDTLEIGAGDYTFKPGTMTSVETLALDRIDSNQSATIVMNDANVPAGQQLNVTLFNCFNTTFNGSKETDGTFDITTDGGANDNFTGGAGNDIMHITVSGNDDGGGGNDTIYANAGAVIQGGMGADTIDNGSAFKYVSAAESTGDQYDTFNDINVAAMKINMPGTVSAIDAAVTVGALSTATFDTDLAAAVGAAQLGAGHALIFTPNSGTLAGDHFLIVDANGTAGYQAGQDYVMMLESVFNITALSTNNFN